MIRGIILLILSCVVLTLQSNLPCSCDPHPGSAIYDLARDENSYPYMNKVDMSEMPYDAVDVENFYNQVSQEHYVGNTETNVIEGLLNTVLGKLNLVQRVILFFEELLAGLKIEIKALGIYIKIRIDQLIIEVQGIFSPIQACNHVLDLMKLLSRKRYAERCQNYLETKIDLDKKYSGLLDEQTCIMRKAVSASKGLDDKVSKCGRGLLGGLFCDKLHFLLGAVGDILQTLLTLIANLLHTLRLHLDEYIQVLNGKLSSPENYGMFSKLTDDDLIEEIFASEIKKNYAQLENNQVTTPEQIIERLSLFCSDERRKKVTFDLLDLHMQGYKLSNHRFTCPEFGVGLGLLELELSVQLSLLGVEVGVDINTGVATFNHAVRAIILALTGSPHCHTNIISNVDGIVAIGIKIDLDLVRDFFSPVYSLTNMYDSLDLPVIDQKVYDISEDVKSNCMNGVDNIITKINEQSQIRKEIMDGISESSPYAYSLLDERKDAEAVQNAEREATKNAIISANDNSEIREILNQRLMDHKDCELENDRAALESINIYSKTAEARIASCTENLYQAELDHLNEPSNADYTQAYERRCAELKEALILSVKVHQQYLDLQAKLELKIGGGEQELIDLHAKIGLCLEDLRIGVRHSLVDLKIKLTLNSDGILFILSDLLKAIFPRCEVVEYNWRDLDSDEGYPGLDMILEDEISEEELEVVTECHRKILQNGLELLSGNPVEAITTPYQKRNAVLGILDNLLRRRIRISLSILIGLLQSEEYGKRDIHDIEIVPEPTSSASSFGFSFIMLFGSLLSFVFFK